jgi:hypothetical protein
MLAGALLVLAAGSAASAADKELEKLHVLMVLDTSDKDLKPTLDVDRSRFLTTLIIGTPEARMKLTIFEGKNVTIKKVMSYYETGENIKRDGTASLLFYFSGHGATVESTGKHVILLSGSGKPELLERDAIREAMQKLNPGLAVMLTDSCSSYIPHVPPHVFVPPDVRAPKDPVAGFRRLFFESRGLVDINGAREGTLAWSDANDGGIFTRAFSKELLKEQDSDSITWEKFALQLRGNMPEIYKAWKKDQTEESRRSGAPLDRDLVGQKDQTPQFYALPGGGPGLMVDVVEGSVKVTDVLHASPAKEAGVRIGDVILKFDGAKIATLADFEAALRKAKSGSAKEFVLSVQAPAGELVDRVVKLK